MSRHQQVELFYLKKLAPEPHTIFVGTVYNANLNFVGRKYENKSAPIFFNVQNADNFVGRMNELVHLEHAMKTSAEKHVIVVTGLGGIGKTQLARKFIDKIRMSYMNVIWIDSENRQGITDSFESLAQNILNIPTTHRDGREKDFHSIVELVFNRLSVNKTLIVYDNVGKIEDIKHLFTMQPSASGANLDVLITSRIQNWGDEIDVVQLKVWELDDAVQYVSTTLGVSNDWDEVKLLVETLQAFPLALRQAAAYVSYQQKFGDFRIVDYIRIYNTCQQQLLDSRIFQRSVFNVYNNTPNTTWSVTIDTIKRDGAIGQLAVRILQIMAYFDPHDIRSDIFIHLTFEAEDLPLCKKIEIENEDNVKEALRSLVNYSMVDSRNRQSVLSIHRLVQQVIKLKLHSSHQEKPILRDCLLLVSKLIDNNKLQENLSHAVSVFLSALTYSDLVKEFNEIPCAILNTLVHCGQYNRAKEFGDKILLPLTNILGEDHRDTLTCKSIIDEISGEIH